jgi:hypothetical protein
MAPRGVTHGSYRAEEDMSPGRVMCSKLNATGAASLDDRVR